MKESRISLSLLAALLLLSGALLLFGVQKRASSDGLDPEIQTGRMSPEVVVERLTAFEGYSEVTSIELEGDTYAIKAVRNGREADVQVNSLVGTITDQSERYLHLPAILTQ